MIAKTSCQHCGIHIEFEVEHANQFAPCPSCGKQTRLLLPGNPKSQATPPTPLPKPSKQPEPIVRICPVCQNEISRKASACPNCGEPNKESNAGQLLGFGAAVLFIVGFGLVLNGCGGELDESKRSEGSAIRQTFYALQYGSGFISIGLSMVLAALVRIIRKP